MTGSPSALAWKRFVTRYGGTRIHRRLATLPHARLPPHPRLAAGPRSFHRAQSPRARLRRKGHAKLGAQLTSSVHSIATNIVEGCGAATHKEFARFLDISIKSANETEYHLLTSHDLELISDAAWQKYSAETIEVRKMIYAYRAAVLRDDGRPAPTGRPANNPPMR